MADPKRQSISGGCGVSGHPSTEQSPCQSFSHLCCPAQLQPVPNIDAAGWQRDAGLHDDLLSCLWHRWCHLCQRVYTVCLQPVSTRPSPWGIRNGGDWICLWVPSNAHGLPLNPCAGWVHPSFPGWCLTWAFNPRAPQRGMRQLERALFQKMCAWFIRAHSC